MIFMIQVCFFKKKSEGYSQPARRLHGDIVPTLFCPFQQPHSYISNETPNDVSTERREVV